MRIDVGFSDHSIGVNACLLALSKGANIIEKHFTLNKESEGPDHNLSANEKDLKLICDFAKSISTMGGTGTVNPTRGELKIKKIARKSVYVKEMILKNDKFTNKNLEIRRPEGFFDPALLNQILNKKSLKNINVGTNLKTIHIKNYNQKSK